MKFSKSAKFCLAEVILPNTKKIINTFFKKYDKIILMENLKPFKTPKISVIITCYNLGKYLGECVNSVLNQKYKNFEIIVVNDCSTDNTKEISETFPKEVKTIHLKENLGQFSAFLEGLKIASGEFVCMIDADDVLLPDFLSVHLQVHMQTSVAFTSCAQFEIDDNSTIVSLNSLATPGFQNESYEDKIKTLDEIFNLDRLNENFTVKTLDIKKYPFGSWNWNPTSSAMMRKAAADYLLLYKTPKDWMKGADKIAFSFLHLIGGSALISAPLMAYRRHKTNLSSANPVIGNFRYLKPSAIKLYIGYNKRIRQDVLKFIFGNYSYFCAQFNPLNVRKMVMRVIFSFDRNTIKRIFKSFFVH